MNTEALGLSEIVSNAADIGMQLSGKVRQLDIAKVCLHFFITRLKNRVQNVEALIGNIITLCDCLSNTRRACEANDIIDVGFIIIKLF